MLSVILMANVDPNAVRRYKIPRLRVSNDRQA